jgi:DNA-directed RNA polymerase specialized sigma24 family protein
MQIPETLRGANLNGQEVAGQVDASLLSFLHTTDEEESRRLCDRLVSDHADHVIKDIIRRELDVCLDNSRYGYYDSVRIQDAHDIRMDTIEKLLRRLHFIKNSAGSDGIDDFGNYVATVTRNACCDYLRRKFPLRWRLKNQLRFFLTHQEGFALWENDMNDLVCGFSSWLGASKTREYSEALDRLKLTNREIQSANIGELLTAIFKQLEAPLRLEDLIKIIAELRKYGDGDDGQYKRQTYNPHSTEPGFAVRTEQRALIKHLWQEICKLSIRQRTALLLNLRDEEGYGIALFPYSGIATIKQIAELLEIPYEQFAKMWNDLPIDDATIANHLGLMRQQVINLRKAARERLARHMRALFG